jgi:hypothetical protein
VRGSPAKMGPPTFSSWHSRSPDHGHGLRALASWLAVRRPCRSVWRRSDWQMSCGRGRAWWGTRRARCRSVSCRWVPDIRRKRLKLQGDNLRPSPLLRAQCRMYRIGHRCAEMYSHLVRRSFRLHNTFPPAKTLGLFTPIHQHSYQCQRGSDYVYPWCGYSSCSRKQGVGCIAGSEERTSSTYQTMEGES